MVGRHQHRGLAPFDDRQRPGARRGQSLRGQAAADRLGSRLRVAAGCGMPHRHAIAEVTGGVGGRIDRRGVGAEEHVVHAAAPRRRPDAGRTGRRGRHARTRGDHREVVADHVGEHEHQQAARRARPRQAAPLHGAPFPTGRIQRGDVGSGCREPLGEGDHGGQRHALPRRLQERRTAAGDDRDRQVTRAEIRHHADDLAGRLHHGGRGQVHTGRPRGPHLHRARVAGAARGHADESRDAMPREPRRAEHLGHARGQARGGLAGAHDDDPIDRVQIDQRSAIEHEPATGHGQPPDDERRRVDRGERRCPDRRRVGPQSRHVSHRLRPRPWETAWDRTAPGRCRRGSPPRAVSPASPAAPVAAPAARGTLRRARRF